MKARWKSLLGIGIGVLGLASVYILQRELFYSGFYDTGAGTTKLPDFDNLKFVFSKLIRFLINDGCSLLIIYGLFRRDDFMQFGFRLFLIELLILLPIYFSLTIFAFEQTRFFLQHLHRLVVNPVLMMLLIPAFYYQITLEKQSPNKQD
jgi:exosortase F-associated protein